MFWKITCIKPCKYQQILTFASSFATSQQMLKHCYLQRFWTMIVAKKCYFWSVFPQISCGRYPPNLSKFPKPHFLLTCTYFRGRRHGRNLPMAKATDGLAFGTTRHCRIKGYRPCRRPLSWAIWFKSWWCLTGPSTWTQNATQPSPDTPKTATSRRSTQNSQTPPKSGRKPSKKPPPAACRSDKSETHKGEETGPSTWTQNATQPSPDTPKTATSRRSTQNSQTPPKSGRKPSKKPSPAACRSDKSETHKGEETGPSTWTQNATQP